MTDRYVAAGHAAASTGQYIGGAGVLVVAIGRAAARIAVGNCGITIFAGFYDAVATAGRAVGV